MQIMVSVMINWNNHKTEWPPTTMHNQSIGIGANKKLMPNKPQQENYISFQEIYYKIKHETISLDNNMVRPKILRILNRC